MVYPQQLIQTFTGETTSNNFGYSVSDAGDINNDGYDDVIVGAYSYSSSTGRAYIFYGGSSLDATPDVIMTGQTTGDSFGSSVSGAGDINKDGFDDVIVGAGSYGSSTGRAYIYYGGVSMDNIADVTMTGEAASYFGGSVSGAGDVNGDGYDDVIIGASNYNTFTGRAYIYYGGVSMDVTPDIIMTGEGIFNFFGLSVSRATHLNNDIYSDVIVGAFGYNSNAGRAYIYFGSSSMDNIADVTFNGVASGDYLGCSVSGVGDVNNDTYSEVIVGAYGYSTSTGRAYIYFGGLSMDNTVDITMTGEATGNMFGISVSGADDVNNDTYSDVIVGAYGYSSNTGRAYIYYGGSSMNNTVDVTMTGIATNNYFGSSLSGAGDVNNDTYSDVIVGAYRYSTSTGRAYIYSDNSAPLPVEVTSFSASVIGSTVKLNWKTATEVNNYGFEIQRSVQTVNWDVLGFVEGHGNSNSPKEYSFLDSEVNSAGTYSYRLKQIDNDGSYEFSKAIEVNFGSPIKFELSQNYPNPFNPSTTISFNLPKSGVATLKVYNLMGEEIKTLVEGYKEAGIHTFNFNAEGYPSGMYLYRLSTNGFTETKKMLLMK